MRSKKIVLIMGAIGAFVTGAVVATAAWEAVLLKIATILYKAGCDTADDMGL